MTCPRCSFDDVREFELLCPACLKELGYPNVRAAKELAEKTALDHRYKQALSAAGMGSYTDVLLRFQAALRSSQAVICRSISKTKDLVSNKNELYASFYELIGAGARRPEKTKVERQRLVADDLLFPFYKNEIRFAALSLDGIGVTSYGICSMVLRDIAISDRTTVFEQNSLDFCISRSLGSDKPVPPGFRALWGDRELLGCAKLYSRLDDKTDDASFASILLSDGDFIEVHIYGSLHRASLERIIIKGPLRGPDKVLLSEIRRAIKSDRLRIIVEEKT
jgi:hypothetical protein